MAPHSSTLAWKIRWTEEPGRLQSMGSLRFEHNWVTSLWLFTFMHWRRKRHPTPVFLPGESQGQGAWWAAVYGVAQSQTQLKWLSSSSSSNTYKIQFHFDIKIKLQFQRKMLQIRKVWSLERELLACVSFVAVQSGVSDSLWPLGLQCARIPCSSLSSRACSNSCPLSQWYHPTISFSLTYSKISILFHMRFNFLVPPQVKLATIIPWHVS